MPTRRRLSLLCCALFCALPARAQGPLPVDKSATWKTDGMAFSVEGRVRIDPKVALASQRALTIRGVGEGATVVVAGSLELKAVTGGTNVFENLTIEVAPECRSLYLADPSCGILATFKRTSPRALGLGGGP